MNRMIGDDLDLSFLGEDEVKPLELDEKALDAVVKESDTSDLAKLQRLQELLNTVKQAEKYAGLNKWFKPGTEYGIEKLPKHAAFFRATATFKEVYFSAANRCLAEGTLVATPNGPVAVEDLNVGDEVFNRYRVPTKVTEKTSRGVDRVLSLRDMSGEVVLECTELHVLDTFNIDLETQSLNSGPQAALYLTPLDAIRMVGEDGEISYTRVTVESGREVAVWDISVAHHEQYFLLANGLSVHNCGKSQAACYAFTCWATGIYPEWWEGKRFARAVNLHAAGTTNKTTRDVIQEALLGPIGSWGTGMIPKELIVSTSSKSGVPNAVDVIQIRNIWGDVSTISLLSYEQGRKAFEGFKSDGFWCDEMPPEDEYSEAFMRTATTGGIMLVTATPLDGMTPLVFKFYSEGTFISEDQELPDVIKQARQDKKIRDEELRRKGEKVDSDIIGKSKAIILAGWDDAPWLDEETKVLLLAMRPPHLRLASSTGVPGTAGGNIYPIPLDEILVDDFPIPAHYKFINGLDVGWQNTAASFGAINPDTGTIYIYADYLRGQAEPAIHASAIKTKSIWKEAPVCIDPASRGRSQQDGKQLSKVYREHGLRIHIADNAVEAGIYKVWEALSTGRLKIFKSCKDFQREYVSYRRDEKGRIVKDNDHCLHPDTLVITDKGKKRIEDLVGTEGNVLTVSGEYVPYTHCRKTAEDQELVELLFDDGGKIVCTPDHRILTKEHEWVEAKDMLYYRGLNAATKNFPVCNSVTKAGRSDVYCLEVPSTHCFAVDEGYIVHNCLDSLRYLTATEHLARQQPVKSASGTGRLGHTPGRVSGIKYF